MNPASNLMQRMAKQFTLKDTIKLSTIPFYKRSLIQCLYPYPSSGVGFKVRRIDQYENIHYEVVSSKIETIKKGEIWAVKYEDGVKDKNGPQLLENVTIAGMYTYELGDSFAHTKNDVVYTQEDMRRYFVLQNQREPIQPHHLRANINLEVSKFVENIDDLYTKIN